MIADRSDDAKHGPWSKQELLLAAAIWELRQLVHVQLLRGQVRNLPQPEPVRTPGAASTRKAADPRAMAYLQQILDRHAEQRQE